jgi:hypothetical protein
MKIILSDNKHFMKLKVKKTYFLSQISEKNISDFYLFLKAVLIRFDKKYE